MSDQHDWMAGMTDFQRAEVARLESRIVSFEKRWQSLEADWNDCKKALATAMAELAASYTHQASSKSVLANVIAERDALLKRVAELEAQPPAASDLRERLVCAALNGILSEQRGLVNHEYALRAIGLADATLAAMRKGGGA